MKISNTVKILIAFAVGQVMQIVAQILATVSYSRTPILFCCCAGGLILAAVVGGVAIAQTDGNVNGSHLTPKTYEDYLLTAKKGQK